MDIARLRKWVLQKLHLHGYSVTADAASYLANQLQPFGSQERQVWIYKIADQIQKLNLSSLIVSKDDIERCLQECSRTRPNREMIFNVINAFQTPRFTYSEEKKKFLADTSCETKSLFPPASFKSYMHRRRYTILLQRTRRFNLFRAPVVGGASEPKFTLRTVEWFLCSTGKIQEAVILGLLVQKSETVYHIEDPTGSLELDISQARFNEGLYLEHCFVLADGIYEDKVFYVVGLSLPPAEPSTISRSYFGNLNTFGGPSETSLVDSMQLAEIERRNMDANIVFMSDVWLDKVKVLEKFGTMLRGFASSPPVAFVLMGNFLSTQYGSSHPSQLKAGLKALSEIISQMPVICDKSYFVLVPGPSDPGSPLIYPRTQFPKYLVEDFISKVPKAIMATNPCRIQYCTKEIVVIREDLITKSSRNAIRLPELTIKKETQYHFAKTIISQATLIPMPLNVCPVYWNYSHSLDLYPLPHLIVTADQYESFKEIHEGCTIINPGNFVNSQFSFQTYIPATGEIDECALPSDD